MHSSLKSAAETDLKMKHLFFDLDFAKSQKTDSNEMEVLTIGTV